MISNTRKLKAMVGYVEIEDVHVLNAEERPSNAL